MGRQARRISDGSKPLSREEQGLQLGADCQLEALEIRFEGFPTLLSELTLLLENILLGKKY